jgi:hypothetical protein
MTEQRKYKRRIKLIKPRLQLRMIATFVGLSALGFLLQALLVAMLLSQTAAEMPEGGPYLMSLIPQMPIEILLMSFGMFLPLTFAVGVLVTFRIAGPIHRFEKYLTAVAKGEQLGPCRIRKGDELHELCELINQATEPVRRRQVVPSASGGSPAIQSAG